MEVINPQKWRGAMTVETNEKLLKNKKVVEEINRHRWIESEKAGHDIGFERASTEWLENFSRAWMEYHMPVKNGAQPASTAPVATKPLARKTSKDSKEVKGRTASKKTKA
jgi:hypothetical protein